MTRVETSAGNSNRAAPLGPYGPVLVTGGGRGIGRAIAIRLAEAGASVCVASRTQEELEATAESIRAAGGEVLCLACDVTDDRQCEALVKQTVSQFGGLSLLVNNAGGAHRIKPLDEISVRDFELGTELNATCRYFGLCTRQHHTCWPPPPTRLWSTSSRSPPAAGWRAWATTAPRKPPWWA